MGRQNIMLTEVQQAELLRCAADPVYFINTYVRYQSPMKGTTPLVLTSYNEQQVKLFESASNVINCSARQSGKSIVAMAYFLWLIHFKNGKYVVVTPNTRLGYSLFGTFEFMLSNLPFWMRAKTTALHPNKIKFVNGGEVRFGVASSYFTRGAQFDHAYIDEAAYIEPQAMHDLFYSLVPLLSMGSKLIMSSTPSSVNNLFHKVWVDTKAGMSTLFQPFQVTINDIPALNTTAHRNMLRLHLGDDAFEREFLCKFP